MRRSEASMVLGLVGPWEPDDVKRNYRRLVTVAHPDRGGNADQFRRVQEAYELLQGTSSADHDNAWDVAHDVWPAAANGDYRMATGAMTYLAVEPDLLDHLADICGSWEGQIEHARKAVLRQLGWLVVGVVPFGAVITAAKVQRYRSTGTRFLAALQTVKHDGGMGSAAAWNELGRTYVSLLGLLDLDAAVSAVDLARYATFVDRLDAAITANDVTAVMGCMEEAQRYGRRHHLANFVRDSAGPTVAEPESGTPSRSTKTTAQRLAFAAGKKFGAFRN